MQLDHGRIPYRRREELPSHVGRAAYRASHSSRTGAAKLDAVPYNVAVYLPLRVGYVMTVITAPNALLAEYFGYQL